MSVRLYMDVHLPYPVTEGLRRRAIDVVTSQEDETTTWADTELLARATELRRTLVSQDEDLLKIARELQGRGIPFSGEIYAHQLNIGIGDLVRDLEMLAECCDPNELANQVTYLPLA